jgi:hypothetical protein
MRKIAMLAVLGALVLVVPANAHKSTKPAKPAKPAKPHPCVAHEAGYNARGTLVKAGTILTPSGPHRYSGAIEANVTRANHHAAPGDQTFTLTDAKVKFHHGLTAAALADGDRVGLHGDITKLPKRCSTTGFTPTITIEKVDISQPKKAKH